MQQLWNRILPRSQALSAVISGQLAFIMSRSFVFINIPAWNVIFHQLFGAAKPYCRHFIPAWASSISRSVALFVFIDIPGWNVILFISRAVAAEAALVSVLASLAGRIAPNPDVASLFS